MAYQTNIAVRTALLENDMYLWQLAGLLEVSETTMTRMMRKELPEERQNELVELIKRASNQVHRDKAEDNKTTAEPEESKPIKQNDNRFPHLATLKEAAEITHFSYYMLRKMCLENRVKHVSLAGKFYINMDDLARLMS